MIESIKRIYLAYISPHYRAKRPEFLFILAYLRTVGSLGLLDPLHKLGNLFPGRIKLSVNCIIIRRKALIVILKSKYLLRQILLFAIEIIYKGIL